MSRSNIYVLQNYNTLDLATDGGGTATPVAGIQEVTLVSEMSMEQLYTADSIKIADQMQHEAAINVEIGYSFWDGDVAAQWLGGGGDATSTSLSDTSKPQKYQITANFKSRDDGQQIDLTVEGITFESMPLIEASRGEFVQWDLSGTGEDVTNYDVTTTP
jgi:hypothetical protein